MPAAQMCRHAAACLLATDPTPLPLLPLLQLPADGTSASRPGTAGRASNRGSMIVVRASATSGGATPRSASPRPGTPRLVARQE